MNPQSYRQACDRCHAQKLKCLLRNEPNRELGCQRCHRARIPCLYSQRARKGEAPSLNATSEIHRVANVNLPAVQLSPTDTNGSTILNPTPQKVAPVILETFFGIQGQDYMAANNPDEMEAMNIGFTLDFNDDFSQYMDAPPLDSHVQARGLFENLSPGLLGVEAGVDYQDCNFNSPDPDMFPEADMFPDPEHVNSSLTGMDDLGSMADTLSMRFPTVSEQTVHRSDLCTGPILALINEFHLLERDMRASQSINEVYTKPLKNFALEKVINGAQRFHDILTDLRNSNVSLASQKTSGEGSSILHTVFVPLDTSRADASTLDMEDVEGPSAPYALLPQSSGRKPRSFDTSTTLSSSVISKNGPRSTTNPHCRLSNVTGSTRKPRRLSSASHATCCSSRQSSSSDNARQQAHCPSATSSPNPGLAGTASLLDIPSTLLIVSCYLLLIKVYCILFRKIHASLIQLPHETTSTMELETLHSLYSTTHVFHSIAQRSIILLERIETILNLPDHVRGTIKHEKSSPKSSSDVSIASQLCRESGSRSPNKRIRSDSLDEFIAPDPVDLVGVTETSVSCPPFCQERLVQMIIRQHGGHDAAILRQKVPVVKQLLRSSMGL